MYFMSDSSCCKIIGNYNNITGQSRGTVRLVQNGMTNTTSGIVEVFYSNYWGGICSTDDFGQNEADVICHQLGYVEANSYSTAGQER